MAQRHDVREGHREEERRKRREQAVEKKEGKWKSFFCFDGRKEL